MVLAGLERVDAGTVRIAGELLNGKSEDQVAAFPAAATSASCFQSFHLIPNMTALENVAVPLELAGPCRSVRRGRRESWRPVGLSERADALSRRDCPAASSSAWRSPVRWRLSAAHPDRRRADRQSRPGDGRQIADLLFAKAAERGMTLVLVTHDPALAARCSRQVAMRSGRIEAGGAGAGGASAIDRCRVERKRTALASSRPLHLPAEGRRAPHTAMSLPPRFVP